ncbi:hypothetical protein Syun_005714 [Stephania yunnanensis]|uniref:MIF4G-like type 1 domain-containing protein n=1 Tax=Stephania yunnanensis TaxID=152371 RepID=A0AAP0KVA5_9MAGN
MRQLRESIEREKSNERASKGRLLQFEEDRSFVAEQINYPRRLRRLNIFPASKTEDLQPIDRFVVEEYLCISKECRRVVRALFEKIADLDMECRTRLVLWFSHHLSNFQFIRPWEEWAFVLGLPKWAPQRVFVQEVLEREVRLSYWGKIKQNAPELEELLPPKVGSNFRYSTEDGVERTSLRMKCRWHLATW